MNVLSDSPEKKNKKYKISNVVSTGHIIFFTYTHYPVWIPGLRGNAEYIQLFHAVKNILTIPVFSWRIVLVFSIRIKFTLDFRCRRDIVICEVNRLYMVPLCRSSKNMLIKVTK